MMPPSLPLSRKYATYARSAYAEEEEFKARTEAAGFRSYGDEFFLFRQEGLIVITEDQRKLLFLDVQAHVHVSHSRKQIVVAFRGTQTSVWADWIKSLKAWTEHVPGKGRIHAGFYEEVCAIGPQILSVLDHSATEGYEVTLTGHSKGGSHCTVFRHIYGVKGDIYTFGECRSLTRSARKYYRINGLGRHARFVNTIDVVPKLLWITKRHVGELIYLSRRGEWVLGRVDWWDRFITRTHHPVGGWHRHSMDRYLELLSPHPPAKMRAWQQPY